MLAALNGSDAYRSLFRELFPETGPPLNQPIDFYMRQGDRRVRVHARLRRRAARPVRAAATA